MQSLHKIERSNVTGGYLSELWYLSEKEVFTTTTKNVCIYIQIGAFFQKLPAIERIVCTKIPDFFLNSRNFFKKSRSIFEKKLRFFLKIPL